VVLCTELGMPVTAVIRNSSGFCYITPCSPLKVSGRFGRTYHLHLYGGRITKKAENAASVVLVSFLGYSSTLKMEALCSSEMLVEFHRTAWRYIPEDRIVRNNRC
jgi:hypothetical protein